jgi:hypothetical protein
MNRWAEFSVREIAPWQFQTNDGKELGVIHQVGPDSLKATCRLHTRPRCVCWLSKVTDVAVAERDLVRWFSQGVGEDLKTHQAFGRDLKLSYGMRVR